MCDKGYSIHPEACNLVFGAAEQKAEEAESKHKDVSADVDSLNALFTDEKSAPIATALSALYNRVLTVGMTGATQQARNAASGGRSAVAHIQQGDYEMSERFAREAHDMDDLEITDGKPLA